MPQVLDAELVIAHLSEDIPVTHRNEVVGLINTTIAGQRQDALLGKEVVKLKFAQLYIEPRAAEEVVKPTHNSFKVESASWIRGRENIEEKIFLKSPPGGKAGTCGSTP